MSHVFLVRCVSVAALLVATAAQAQSAYTLATLKSSNSLPITPLRIDSQNNVLGHAYYYRYTGLKGKEGTTLPVLGNLVAYYATDLSRWPAGTATTVAPSRLQLVSGDMRAASADGHYIASASTLYTQVNGKLTALPASYIDSADGVPVIRVSNGVHARDLSNLGTRVVPLQINDGAQVPLTRAGVLEGSPAVAHLLPLGAHASSIGVSISPDDTVAGSVQEQTTWLSRAAIWRSKTLQVLDNQPGRGSAALQVNVAGQVLMCVANAAWSTVNYPHMGYTNMRPVVLSQGQEWAIQPLSPGQAVEAKAINAGGTVVGTTGPAQTPDIVSDDPNRCTVVPYGNTRAFIWKDGVTTDLNAWVAARGLKLPTGSVLASALDINDQGSILAVLRTSTGVSSYVRLTAKP